MSRPARLVPALLTLAATLCGCSTGPGGYRFTLFPEGHRLLESTKQVRSAYAGAQPVPRELDKHVAPLYTVEPGDVLLVQPVNLDSPAIGTSQPACSGAATYSSWVDK